jgi:hypothetical protein
MAKAGSKTKEMKHVGFRMPLDVYQDYVTVAEARGLDLSAVLNWATAEFRPVLLLKHAEYQTAMLRASIVGPQPPAPVDQQGGDALATINDLVRQMQELAAVLRTRAPGDSARLAG